MWIWTCPKSPKVITEHHNEADAHEAIAGHVMGSSNLGIPPCEEIHELVDDGIPCGHEACTVPYISSSERR